MANSFTPQQIEQFLQEFFDVVGARQYVGARYIPIFGRAGSDTVEWDDLAPYEPLTVVMHDGVSYVSRRYVPTGIEITDTDYWVETYRFNAQVEQYRQEVLGFQEQIDNRIPYPNPDVYPRYGELGQVLSTLADGSVRWSDPVVPSDEQAEEVITAWLDEHPEATTTVLDSSITMNKFRNDAITALQQEVYPSIEGTYSFSGNASTNDPLIVNINGLFYKNPYLSGGAAYYRVSINTTYSIGHNQVLVLDASDGTVSVKNSDANLGLTCVTLIWKQSTIIKGALALYYYVDLLMARIGAKVPITGIADNAITEMQQEIYPAIEGTYSFSGNASTNDPLVISLDGLYYRNQRSTGTAYTRIQINTSYTLNHNEVLVLNTTDDTLSIVSANTPINQNYVTLAWKHSTTIKGALALYYYAYTLQNEIARPPAVVNRKVMSRQCSGYQRPENSIEAVSAALAGGFRNVRVSAAHTSDGVWYATHSTELKSNATNHCLTYKSSGDPYPNDVDINTVPSTLIEDLLFYGYDIPTLESVLELCSQFDADVTIEIKDDVAVGTVAQSLVDLVLRYRPNAVLSGLTQQCENVCTVKSGRLDIAVIMHYTAADATSAIATFITGGAARSLRLDCFYGDTITDAELSRLHLNDVTVKLGGSSVTADDAIDYLKRIDIVEVDFAYSNIRGMV